MKPKKVIIKQIARVYYETHIVNIKEGRYLVHSNFFRLLILDTILTTKQFYTLRNLYLYYLYLSCVEL